MDAVVTSLDEVALCRHCSAKCALFTSLSCSLDGRRAFISAVETRGPFASGERVFNAGHVPRAIYVIREGAVKCERVSANGSVHVAGFHLSGELLGCEDIGAEQHSYDAVALEESWLCEISLDKLKHLFAGYPELHTGMLLHLSERLRSSEKMLTNSFHMRAKQRLLKFLCDLYTRLAERKRHQGRAIPLPMSKLDIANHLGMSPETLSRLLRELESEELIHNGGRDIELFQAEMLLCHSGA